MSRRTVTTPDFVYVIAPDVDLPVLQRTWAVVITQLTDELTGNAPAGAVRISCDNPNFTPRVGNSGYAGLAAIPAKALPLLAAQSYHVTLSVAPEGYIPDSRAVTLAAGVFPPPPLPVWPFHRDPISIYGSVNLATATGPVPVGGAS